MKSGNQPELRAFVISENHNAATVMLLFMIWLFIHKRVFSIWQQNEPFTVASFWTSFFLASLNGLIFSAEETLDFFSDTDTVLTQKVYKRKMYSVRHQRF